MLERGGERARPRGPARCVYCHDDVRPEEAAECSRCGTLLHPDCRASLTRCPTVGCGDRAPRVVAPTRAGGPWVFAVNHLARSKPALGLAFTWMALLCLTLNVVSVHLSDSPREHIVDSAPEGSREPFVVREVPRWPPLVVAWYALVGAAAAAALQAAITRSAWRRLPPG